MIRDYLRLINRLLLGPIPKIRRFFSYIPRIGSYLSELFVYRGASKEDVPLLKLQPCIDDKFETSPIDYFYFYQDTWGARKVFEAKPSVHVDVGSTTLLVGILSQFTKVISVDVRPLDVRLKGLESKRGNITAMPFPDNSVESLSSLCVIEHIGLGRYGDPLDPEGSDKAAREFCRILKKGGNLYVSTQIGPKDEVLFNAHRVFELNGFLKRFRGLTLVESLFIQYNNVVGPEGFKSLDFTKDIFGCFHFRK